MKKSKKTITTKKKNVPKKIAPARKKTSVSKIKKIEVVKVVLVPKKKEKKVSIMYFTPDTEKAIIEYNSTDDTAIRNKIYTERIQYAFEKIAENIFNTFKFSYNEVCPLRVQQEAVTHMVSNISKYNPVKGAGRSFGYFSIVAKNWFILSNAANYKRFKTHTEIIDEPGTTTHGEFIIHPEHSTSDRDNQEFVQLLVKYWDDHLDTFFQKPRDKHIAGAVVDLFRHCNRIELFNKKALYLYIREHSGCHTQNITKIINNMLFNYGILRREYLSTGTIVGEFMSFQK